MADELEGREDSRIPSQGFREKLQVRISTFVFTFFEELKFPSVSFY